MIENEMFNLLKKIGFTRVSGSDEEKKAAKIILEQIEKLNIKGYIEEFDVTDYQIDDISVITNDNYKLDAIAYRNSGSIDKLEAPFFYMESFTSVDIKKAKGCIVLTNERLTYDSYKKLVDAKVAGIITYSGDVIDNEKNTDLENKELRETVKQFAGESILSVNIRAKDAMKLVKLNPKTITISVKQHQVNLKSQNVICEIPGKSSNDEIIVFTAHYDSVYFSKGVYDNGAGSVILMQLLKYYLKNKPERTIKFIWCGSEERGLLGSKAYVKQHENELKNIVLNINVDVGGCVLGKEYAICTAHESLVNFVDYLYKINGKSVNVSKNIYSSDSIPFANKGIPAINFARFGSQGGAHIHNRHDTLYFLDKKYLKSTYDNVLIFTNSIINSFVFPIERTLPTDIIDKVDNYLKNNKQNKEE